MNPKVVNDDGIVPKPMPYRMQRVAITTVLRSLQAHSPHPRTETTITHQHPRHHPIRQTATRPHTHTKHTDLVTLSAGSRRGKSGKG